MEKLTLITITYNRIKIFKRLLESLKLQTILPDEFIISDDGSENTDEFIKLLKEEEDNFPNMTIKFIKQEDLGFRASRARNNAVRETKNKLLIFIDSDIIMPPKFLEIFYKNKKNGVINLSRSIRLEETATESITLEEIRKNDLRKYYTFKSIWKNIERFFRDKFYFYFRPGKTAGKFRTMAFSMYREDYIAINGFDEKFVGWGSEDVEFGIRAFFNELKLNNSHLTNFQLHQWHGNYSKGTEEEELYKKTLEKQRDEGKIEKGYFPEYGYNKTYGDDKYSVVEI